jgi:hypothetical protein
MEMGVLFCSALKGTLNPLRMIPGTSCGRNFLLSGNTGLWIPNLKDLLE